MLEHAVTNYIVLNRAEWKNKTHKDDLGWDKAMVMELLLLFFLLILMKNYDDLGNLKYIVREDAPLFCALAFARKLEISFGVLPLSSSCTCILS